MDILIVRHWGHLLPSADLRNSAKQVCPSQPRSLPVITRTTYIAEKVTAFQEDTMRIVRTANTDQAIVVDILGSIATSEKLEVSTSDLCASKDRFQADDLVVRFGNLVLEGRVCLDIWGSDLATGKPDL